MSLMHPLGFPRHLANHGCYNIRIRTLPKSNLQRMGFIFHEDYTVRWNQSDIFVFSFVPEFVFLCSGSRPPRLAHMAVSAVGRSQAWLRMPAATPGVALRLLGLPEDTPCLGIIPLPCPGMVHTLRRPPDTLPHAVKSHALSLTPGPWDRLLWAALDLNSENRKCQSWLSHNNLGSFEQVAIKFRVIQKAKKRWQNT